MKLSVQYMQRTWKDKVENWDEYLDKFSKTLIDQIDNLASIASAFSNFAKMPKTQSQEVDIISKINNIASLFVNDDDLDFSIDLSGYKEIIVISDKKQILRVFNNLVKNSIQSIPKSRRGKIKISLVKLNSTVIIRIEDNGCGIPDELRGKLFQPNFTTKSGGMGLGLAITRNIIESSGGKIWYETEIDKGTTFFIELPVAK